MIMTRMRMVELFILILVKAEEVEKVPLKKVEVRVDLVVSVMPTSKIYLPQLTMLLLLLLLL
jgi:hypothetical protein